MSPHPEFVLSAGGSDPLGRRGIRQKCGENEIMSLTAKPRCCLSSQKKTMDSPASDQGVKVLKLARWHEMEVVQSLQALQERILDYDLRKAELKKFQEVEG